MKRFTPILILALALVTLGGCRTRVDSGHVGRTQEANGFTGELLAPGLHSCYGRCKMYTMETTDKEFRLPINVMCADELNFSFDLNVLVATNMDNPEVVKRAFESIVPAGKADADGDITAADVFTVDQLFNTYIRSVADQEARKVIGKYKTTEIAAQRDVVIEEVRTAVMQATSSTILSVKRVTVGNLDFPKVLTDARIKAAETQVAIETARAEGGRKAAEAEANLKLARIQAKQDLVQAQAIADSNRIISSSITPEYLAYKQIEAQKLAADGENNIFFIPYHDAVNGPVAAAWNPVSAAKDAVMTREIIQK